MTLKVKRLCERASLPSYAHPGEDACFDLRVLIDDAANAPRQFYNSREESFQAPLLEDSIVCDADGNTIGVKIRPKQSIVFKTGLAFEIEPGFVMKVYARSSTGIKKHLALDNGTGIIDSGYRNQIHIALHNFGTETITIRDGDRVAQAEICRVEPVEFVESETLSDSSRGLGGIGSSGKN